jgi:hypothetical protein
MSDARTKLMQHGFGREAIEVLPDGGVVLTVSEGEYAKMLAMYDFSGEALRAALETITGMGREFFAVCGGGYMLGFSGDIDETRAREREYARTERIKAIRRVLASVPDLESELAALEADDE